MTALRPYQVDLIARTQAAFACGALPPRREGRVILALACPDYPGHARRVVREPLCPACVVSPAVPAVPPVDATDVLLAAGWEPSDRRPGGLWRDPADGALRTEAHALRLARKDAGEVRT